MKISTIEIKIRRFSVISSAPFDVIVGRLGENIGQPDMNEFRSAVLAARSTTDLEGLVKRSVGPSELMEFDRFDAGEVLRKENRTGPKILRLVVGNPLIMKEMARTVPD